jgi:hypothetical protein
MPFYWVVEMKMRIFEWLVQIVLEQFGLWILVICLGESYKAVGLVEYVAGFSKLWIFTLSLVVSLLPKLIHNKIQLTPQTSILSMYFSAFKLHCWRWRPEYALANCKLTEKFS